MEKAEELIDRFNLKPHPEGGYYRRVHTSSVQIPASGLPDRYSGSRHSSSHIFYLLEADQVSRLHRIDSEEGWNFYGGNSLDLHVFADKGYDSVRLGTDFLSGDRPYYSIPAECWFGATVQEGFAFVGCTVSPEFQFEGYELADAESLKKRFPEQTELIEELT